MGRRWTVVQLIPAMNAGGAERSTIEVARALVAAGHRSIVISAGGRWQSRLSVDGSEHITLPLDRKAVSALWTAWRLRRVLRALKPDLIHVRSRLPAWIARLALLGVHGVARVSTVHGLNSVNAYSRIMTRAERVIAVSRTTRAHLLTHYPQLDPAIVRVIPRGVDAQEFDPQRALDPDWRAQFEADFPALVGGKLLTLPGRGTRLKGHADAIRLLAALRARGLDARLLLLGVIESGREAYRSELMRLAAELGVGELLQDYYPAGLVPLGNLDIAAERAEALLTAPPPVGEVAVPTVTDLQRLTLSVYAELLEGAAPDPACLADR